MTADLSPLILVVEDDPETRRFYAEVFSGDGFRVEQAHNGHQALDKARASLPDLILTDIAVPGIDGIELCQKLRADVATAEIPILGITGHDDRRYSDRARMAGADGMLAKPCGPDVLVAEARRLPAANRSELSRR